MPHPQNAQLSEITIAHLTAVGENLGIARRAFGMSQVNLAEMGGMGTSTVVAIEKGSAKVSLIYWLRVMEVLGLHSAIMGFGSLGENKALIEQLGNRVPKRAPKAKKA